MLQQSSAELSPRWGQSLGSLNFHSTLKMVSSFKGVLVSSLSHPPPLFFSPPCSSTADPQMKDFCWVPPQSLVGYFLCFNTGKETCAQT